MNYLTGDAEVKRLAELIDKWESDRISELSYATKNGIEQGEKKKQIESLKNERGNHYDFHPFGSIKELYGKTNILNEQIEEKAKRVHLAYNPSDKKLKEYYKIEYYKKSSRAFALHIKYKLYSILKDEMNNVEKIQEAINNPKIQEKLAKNEHDRWNAYMRSECYKKASIKEVENYHQETALDISPVAVAA